MSTAILLWLTVAFATPPEAPPEVPIDVMPEVVEQASVAEDTAPPPLTEPASERTLAAPQPSPPEPATPEPGPPVPSRAVPVAPAVAPAPVVVDFVGPIQPQNIASSLSPFVGLFPAVPVRGFLYGLVLLVLTLGFAALSQLLLRARSGLAAEGLLPSLAQLTGTLFRVLAVFFGLGVVAAWVPASVAPALPWILVGGAVALGWSARDVLPDMVAWLFLAMEGHVRTGVWVEGPGFAGEVMGVGLRGTILSDASGREVSIPNRRLLVAAVHHDASPWPVVEVAITLPRVHTAARTRAAIRDAALLSPWVAPNSGIELLGDPAGSNVWRVRIRLLEGQFVGVFEGSLRERVLEQFGSESVEP